MKSFYKSVLVVLLYSLLASSCAATASSGSGSSLLFTETDDPMAAASAASTSQGFNWKKPPSPITGKWVVVGCEQKQGMIVEFALSSDRAAAGEVVEPGRSELMGYQAGEGMFKDLIANDFGAWRGQHKWRNAFGVERWDPIYLIIEGDILIAKMTTDACLKKMERLP